jgi:hypothetical protein
VEEKQLYERTDKLNMVLEKCYFVRTF